VGRQNEARGIVGDRSIGFSMTTWGGGLMRGACEGKDTRRVKRCFIKTGWGGGKPAATEERSRKSPGRGNLGTGKVKEKRDKRRWDGRVLNSR